MKSLAERIEIAKFGKKQTGDRLPLVVGTGAVRPPVKAHNKDDKRPLEQVIRVSKKTIADIQAGS